MSTHENDQQPADSGEGALLTAGDVAARLRVSKSWVYAEAQAGRLPAGRFGRHCRFRAQDLERYIEESFGVGQSVSGLLDTSSPPDARPS